MKFKLLEYLAITYEFWEKRKGYFLFLIALSTATVFMQAISIGFALPTLEFLESNGAPDMSKDFWVKLVKVIGFFGGDLSLLNILLATFITLFLGQCLSYFRIVELHKLFDHTKYQFRKKILELILDSKYEETRSFSESYIANLFNVETNAAANMFYNIFVYLFNVLTIIAYIFILFMLSPTISIYTACFSLLIMGVTKLKLNKSKIYGERLVSQNQQLMAKITERVRILKFIKAMAIEERTKATILDIGRNNMNQSILIAKLRSGMDLLLFPIGHFFILSVIFISYKLSITFSLIIVYLFLLNRIVPLLKSNNQQAILIESQMASFKIVKGFIEKNNNKNSQSIKNSIPIKSGATIQLEKVEFSYHKNEPILNALSFDFKSNRIYAIVGSSGSGKTTLVDIIMGLLTPTLGETKYSSGDLKKLFYMTQQPAIIQGTIRENLCFSVERPQENISDDILYQALEKVNLLKTIKKKGGLDLVISESGKNLSGGQMQRLVLARLFIEKKPLIILDEHTSSIDKVSKDIINAAIKKINNSLIIMISHDEDTIKEADEILFIRDGEIVESGHYDQLLKRKGFFKEVYPSK